MILPAVPIDKMPPASLRVLVLSFHELADEIWSYLEDPKDQLGEMDPFGWGSTGASRQWECWKVIVFKLII